MRITDEQIDTLLAFIDGHPAAQINNGRTLPISADNFKLRFNAEVIPILRRDDLNDEERTTLKKLFLIEKWKILNSPVGKVFMNVFDDNAAIFGVTGKDGDRFKFILCAFTPSETPNDKIHASLIVAALAKVLLPSKDARKFLQDLTAVNNMIIGGMEFSLGKVGDLILISAAKEGAV